MSLKITQDIKEIISSSMMISNKLLLKTSFDDLHMDSLDRLDMIMKIEGHFDIEIPDEIHEQFNTVKDIVAYVKNKLKDNNHVRS